jgi:hypothetical protein
MPGGTPGTQWNPSARRRDRAHSTIPSGAPLWLRFLRQGGTVDLQSGNPRQSPAKKLPMPFKKARIALVPRG